MGEPAARDLRRSAGLKAGSKGDGSHPSAAYPMLYIG